MGLCYASEQVSIKSGVFVFPLNCKSFKLIKPSTPSPPLDKSGDQEPCQSETRSESSGKAQGWLPEADLAVKLR